ncbi:MAG: metallophosphoesterase [Clostridiales Family XIII bacterium]|jgi:predicted phosphohydrolase|nr:metallophosphoesterase [Clostridiales Family XIII bacterium]
MSIFAVADLHLSMSGEKPMDIFGAAWTDHAARLRENWLRDVREEDTVIVAGDISWALKQPDATADLEWVSMLPGKKVFVKGNHDLWWNSVTKLNQFHPGMYFLQNTFYAAEGIAICGSRGWLSPGDEGYTEHDEKIYRRELSRLEASLKAARDAGFDEIIAVLHFPPTNRMKEESGFTGLMRAYGVGTAVYGHLHGVEVFGNGLKGFHYGTEYHLVSLDYLECGLLKLR